MERFEEVWKTADAAAGVKCLVPTIKRTSEKYKDLSDDEWIEAMKAVCFFNKANKMRFESKIREVSETVVTGVDNYPATLDAAYRILTETQQRMNAGRAASEQRGAGATTASAISVTGTSNYQRRSIPDGQDIVMGTDRREYNVQYNNCNGWGHYSRECPRASSKVSNNSKSISVPHRCSDVLKHILDTGSTHTTVKDNNDLTNLFKSKILQMKSSTGDTMDYEYTGRLKPFGVQAHYNILSFHMLAAIKDAYMTYDSRIADSSTEVQ